MNRLNEKCAQFQKDLSSSFRVTFLTPNYFHVNLDVELLAYYSMFFDGKIVIKKSWIDYTSLKKSSMEVRPE